MKRLVALFVFVIFTVALTGTMVVVSEKWPDGVQAIFDLVEEGEFISSAVVFSEELIVVVGFGRAQSAPDPEIRQMLMQMVSFQSHVMIQSVTWDQWSFLVDKNESLSIKVLKKELQDALKSNWPDIDIDAGQLPPGIQTKIYENQEEDYFLAVSLLFLRADSERTENSSESGPSGQVSCPDDL